MIIGDGMSTLLSEHECLAKKVVFAEGAFIVYLNERYYIIE
ncbi:MAG: hypothetical protein QY310_06290 [Candidatus Jettenia sp. CY-1]|nr:MAG: hypothetical protein QY310_06290 [Candidatus Jettenia sp. CY-1]